MEVEFSFVIPCLNEEKTLLFCIQKIQQCIKFNNLSAEILIADNGSTDKSVEIARNAGASVVICNNKGYGNTLINGTNNAKGKYCIIGDCDGSYDFTHLNEFIQAVRNGYDLVVGNRFKGGIEKNAMPWSHKYGVKFLSAIANLFFRTPIKDYHGGLRAYNTESIKSLNLCQGGMEYASEMIIVAQINKLKLLEVKTTLRKDLRDRKPHLRTIRDGFRHLLLILLIAINKKKYIKREKYYEKNNAESA